MLKTTDSDKELLGYYGTIRQTISGLDVLVMRLLLEGATAAERSPQLPSSIWRH